MKETKSRKKDAHKAMCRNSTEENKRRHKSMKNKPKKSVSNTMGEKAEEALAGLKSYSNGMLTLGKRPKVDSKEEDARGND